MQAELRRTGHESSSSLAHRFHLPGHRHKRSKDDAQDPATKLAERHHIEAQSLSREQSISNMKNYQLPMVGRAHPRSPSPTASARTNGSIATQVPILRGQPKGSIFAKLKRHAPGKHKLDVSKPKRDVEQSAPDQPRSGSESKSVRAISKRDSPLTPLTLSKIPTNEGKNFHDKTRLASVASSKMAESRNREDSVTAATMGTYIPSATGFGHNFNSKEAKILKARIKAQKHLATDPNMYSLDTNLENMEGIISGTTPMFTPPDGGGGIVAGEESHRKISDNNEGDTWEVPDSWAVKKVEDDNLARLGEVEEEDCALPVKEDSGMPYFIRVFRQDGTFATISTKLNTSVAEVLHLLGRKSFLQEHLENYNIVLRKHNLQRILKPMDRPLAIQKRLLEQAGYTNRDHLDEVGRDDNSYLCRFTFLPAKLTAFSLEGDATFSRMQKFSHIDLSSRNLVTIPIALYQKASEIISIDLSRNLSLDIPKDFIENCINLRDIKFMSNEASKLPMSISLASRLTYLDFSNNRIEQLDNAGLDRLPHLVSLKLANNKLRHLPAYFSRFKMLRNFYASNNNFDHFPLCLCDMTSMVDLDLSWNSIPDIPEQLAQLTNLGRLTITNNMLSGSLPAFPPSLAALRELDIRYNRLTNIDGICMIPKLETVWATHNRVPAFEGSFVKLQKMNMDYNPVTRFTALANMLTLINLDLSSAKLAQLPDSLYEKMPNLITLVLDKNHFTTLPPQIGRLQKLQTLSVARNNLSSLPTEIGCLQELIKLDLRENNLTKIPPELWFASRLEVLNLSSNVLESFLSPKPGTLPPNIPSVPEAVIHDTPGLLPHSPSWDELGKLDKFGTRRPSQTAGFPFNNSSATSLPAGRKNSNVSVSTASGGRKQSVIPKSSSNTLLSQTTSIRKDSTNSSRVVTFVATLRELLLADNRLDDDVFDEIRQLPELRMLNLSWNAIYDMPPGIFSKWPLMEELYLSGNELSCLPSDDMEHMSSLRTLHLNANKMQTLPSELGSIAPLAVLDVGSNSLKYNVNNWPYDWNWNFNANLRYLNFSGNRRLEIKPRSSYGSSLATDDRDLTDFTGLQSLKILGLMDVTVLNPLVPDQTEDRRVRTSGSLEGSLMYGMADTLGNNECLLTIDMIVPRFRGHEDELLMGLFDGTASTSTGGSKLAKYCHEYFMPCLAAELDQLDRSVETPVDALRRSFLNLNKELTIIASSSREQKIRLPSKAHRGAITTVPLSWEDLETGAVATIVYIEGTQLYAANIGDAQGLLIQSDGGYRSITELDDPANAEERRRIREAGGFVDIKGKMSGGCTAKYGQPDQLVDVSRAFGYVQHLPSCIAAPHVQSITIGDRDELIIIATKELWSLISPEVVMDIARSESSDLMRAAQKIRDLAIAFGARSKPKLTVMILSVSDLRKSSKSRGRTATLSMGPTGSALDESLFRTTTRRPRGNRGDAQPDDSNLARLGQEVEPPTSEVALVFTDIKNSTLLWETFPLAMRSAIKVHNNIMRRQLRIIGGYEVKTEGDAFMVCFPTATSALLWCFSVQSLLLDAPWPSEVLESVHGEEVHDTDGNLLFRGLSVRMGIHWGVPVCEPDPITRRMDYFGPMVNKSSRISAVADGGQITVSADALSEVYRCMHTYTEEEQDDSETDSQYDIAESDPYKESIRRDLQNLQSQGYEVKELGLRNLKGLENPELIFLVYPHVLVGRLAMQQKRDDTMAAAARKGIEQQIAEGDLERTESKVARAYPEALVRAGMGHVPGQVPRERITGNTAGDAKSDTSDLPMDSDTIFALLHVATRLEHLTGCLNHPETRQPGRKKPQKLKGLHQQQLHRALLEPEAAAAAAASSSSSLMSSRSGASYGAIVLKPVDEVMVHWLRQQGENINEEAIVHLLENLVHRIESTIGGLWLRHLLTGANEGGSGGMVPGALNGRGGIWDLLDRVGEHIEASGLSGGLGTPGLRSPR